MSEITIIPTPSNFYRNDLKIGNVTDINEKFKNGVYVASASSFHNMDTLPFNAFNGSVNQSWVSAGKNNADFKYTQDPYSGAKPSVYIGGGSNDNTIITVINKGKINEKKIAGEWI